MAEKKLGSLKSFYYYRKLNSVCVNLPRYNGLHLRARIGQFLTSKKSEENWPDMVFTLKIRCSSFRPTEKSEEKQKVLPSRLQQVPKYSQPLIIDKKFETLSCHNCNTICVYLMLYNKYLLNDIIW